MICVYIYIYIYIYICICIVEAGRVAFVATTNCDGLHGRSSERGILAIFYPLSQFCEIDIALLSS